MADGVVPTLIYKVLAYLVRDNLVGKGPELLVFVHPDQPEAGIQVPAGTIESDESPDMACLREVREESGLDLTSSGLFLGEFDYFHEGRNENHRRHVFQILADPTLPSEWVFKVQSQGEDQNMQFQFYWMPIDEAAQILAADQGTYLKHLKI